MILLLKPTKQEDQKIWVRV